MAPSTDGIRERIGAMLASTVFQWNVMVRGPTAHIELRRLSGPRYPLCWNSWRCFQWRQFWSINIRSHWRTDDRSTSRFRRIWRRCEKVTLCNEVARALRGKVNSNCRCWNPFWRRPNRRLNERRHDGTNWRRNS